MSGFEIRDIDETTASELSLICCICGEAGRMNYRLWRDKRLVGPVCPKCTALNRHEMRHTLKRRVQLIETVMLMYEDQLPHLRAAIDSDIKRPAVIQELLN